MKTACIPADGFLSELWSHCWPLLEPAIRRSPDHPNVLAELRAHNAQLWAIFDHQALIGAVVTKVQGEPDGASRCLLWLVGGSRIREWAAEAMATIGAWA